MNIEAYNLDTLRKLVRDLQTENRHLKDLLAENHIAFEATDAFCCTTKALDEFDPDQASLIEPFPISDAVANKFFSMFWGRKDVYARRGKMVATFLSAKTAGMKLFALSRIASQSLHAVLVNIRTTKDWN